MAQKSSEVEKRGIWSSGLMFILAAAGSAIGLGNVWRFPYITGMYGGGAFVLAYLVCVVLVGFPLLCAEVVIGRSSRRNPVGAFKALSGGSKFWTAVGFIGIVSGFVILSYYSVVAGWTLDYFAKFVVNDFAGKSANQIVQAFNAMIQDPAQQLTWHTIFMAMTIGIVIFGIKEGLERWIEILMPALFLSLLILLIYGLVRGDAVGALKFMFLPDWKKLVLTQSGEFTPRPLMEAMGQAFFSLSLGMGAMITYGSYLGDEERISRAGGMIVLLDTLIAVIAGVAIYTILFAEGLKPEQGPGLTFMVLPIAFVQMGSVGRVLAICFFILLAFAALTSAISLLEVVVAFFIDDLKLSRKIATIIGGLGIYLLGILSALSYNVLNNVSIFHSKDGKPMPILDSFDLLATNYLLPIGGLFIAIFIGWFMSRDEKRRQFLEGKGSKRLYKIWHFLIRYITPILVLILLVFMIDKHLGLGIFK